MLDGGIRVVDGNLGSALILEDDADWDIRIKKQLQAYALSSRKGFASASSVLWLVIVCRPHAPVARQIP